MKLYLFSFCSCLSLISLSQVNTDTTQLSEVIITDNRFEDPLKNQTQQVSSLSAKHISTLPVRSLPEALSFVPGVDIRQRGALGVQADIGIRGASFEQTLLLINGMKLSDPQTGHHALTVPIPLLSIGQVDVLKGPAARVYGQNAFAGAVNIITRPSVKPELIAQLIAGDFNLQSASLHLGLPVKKLKQTLSLSYQKNGNYHYNTDAQQSMAMYDASVPINGHHAVGALVAVATRSFGANGFYSDRYPDQWENTSTLFAGTNYSYTGTTNKLIVRSYYRLNNDEFRLKRFAPEFYTNKHQSRVNAVEVNGRFKSVLGQTGYGIDIRREAITSSNLGNHQRDLLGLFLEQKVRFARFSARAGLYANYFEQYGWHYFPGAELGYKLSASQMLYSNWGYSFRIPTYTELFYRDPVTNSNPDLKPEQAQSIELGYRMVTGLWQLEANFFHRQTYNLIDYVKPITESTSPTTYWTPENFTRVNFTGIEVSASHVFVVRDSLLALSKLNLSYNFIAGNYFKNPEINSRYALNQLRQQAIANLQVLVMKKIIIGLSARYIERQNSKAYFIADVKVDFRYKKQFAVFVECTNINDVNYVEAGFAQMPGRWAKVGVTVGL